MQMFQSKQFTRSKSLIIAQITQGFINSKSHLMIENILVKPYTLSKGRNKFYLG